MYLEYLRAAFHACYYCAVVTDHLEELQRKCLKHVRKPLPKALQEEVKTANIEEEDGVKDEDMEPDAGRSKVKPKEKNDSKDWKRNGMWDNIDIEWWKTLQFSQMIVGLNG